MKRLFDIICATVGLILLSPILLWVTWKIKAEDDGSVFYRGAQVGLHGKLFRIFKFCTMVVDTEKLGASSTSDDDLRITESGNFYTNTI